MPQRWYVVCARVTAHIVARSSISLIDHRLRSRFRIQFADDVAIDEIYPDQSESDIIIAVGI